MLIYFLSEKKTLQTKILLCFCFLLPLQEAVADTNWTYTGIVPGEWTSAGNWDNGVPTSTTNALIDTGTECVIDTGSQNVEVLTVGQSTSNNTLLIQGGSLNSNANAAILGNGTGGMGTATVTGAGSSWINLNYLLIGNYVSSGFSSGILNIQNGGQVSGNVSLIGNNPGATGTATVTGVGSKWTNAGDLFVGNGESGILNIQNGGQVFNDSGLIGNNSGVTGTVYLTDSGSNWTNGSQLYIGNRGTGILNISQNGAVSAFQVIVGANSGSSGTLNLGSQGMVTTASFSGGAGTRAVQFDAGILQASADNSTFISGFSAGELSIQTGGVFIDSQSFSIATDNVFSGVGQIVKLGTGMLALNGTNTSNGGTVTQGTLAINGILPGLLTVDSGAVLKGTGTVGSLVSSGTVAPGNSIGTLFVTGNYVNNSNGTLQNEINPIGQASLLQVNGSALLEGGSLQVAASPGDYVDGTTYKLITANGGLSGSFASATTNLGLNFFLEYLPQELLLIIGQPININAANLHGNPRRVANYFNRFSTFSGDLLTVVEQLRTLDPAELATALDQLHPAPLEALAITVGDTAHMINSTFIDRLSYLRNRSNCCCDLCNCGGFWISGVADFVRQSKTEGLRRFTTSNGGVALGYDKSLWDTLWAGIGAGYSYTNLHWSESAGHADINGYYLGFYASKYTDVYYIDGSILGLVDRNQATRNIDFAAIDRRAKSKFNSYGVNPHLGVGLNINYCSIDVVPFADLDYYYVEQNRVKEHGADSLNLHVKRHQANLLRFETGAKFSKCYYFCGGNLIPTATISYVLHKVLSGCKYTSSFEGIATDFSVFGTDYCFNQLALGAGFQYIISKKLSLNAWYDVELGPKRQEQELNVAINYNF